VRFLGSFARNCTERQWRSGMAAYAPLNDRAMEAFDVLAAAGVGAQTHEADPFLACFARAGDAAPLLLELEQIRAAGHAISFESIPGERARALEPVLSDRVQAAVQIHAQRYVHPPEYLSGLAESFRAGHGEILEATEVTRVRNERGGVTVLTDSEQRRYDAVVVATGADLSDLTSRHGVRQPVQAGRGYRFSVPVEELPQGPLYFPTQRVACTPLGDRLRIAGMMEFRRPGAPLDPRRIRAILDAVRPFLRGVDLEDRRDEWVGSRPCTPDGLPLLGPTTSSRVFVAGGHGMWGITLGPVSGMLLAQAILKQETPPELAPFDPLR
jgi:glycine/D-amino acid oxidase-like deaminating enzyme